MKILFVHQNFPGQFVHLAPALARRGHEVTALTDQRNKKAAPIRDVYRYRTPNPEVDLAKCRLGKTYTEMSERGLMTARAAQQLRDRHGYVPDLVFGHHGWGETLYLREVWPEARHLNYAEFYYAARGRDSDFDAEFLKPNPDRGSVVTARQAHLAHAMAQADAALSPTFWQASSFPACFRPLISVIHDGVNTDELRPDPQARLTLPEGGPQLHAGDEILTLVNRNMEPYRGFHIFMRSLPAVLAARPDAQVVIVGAEGASYGAPPADGESWKQVLLNELEGKLDLSRVHFPGRLGWSDYVRLLQVSRVHAYLTYPFVLSWSLLEAMSVGAHIVASRTAPVAEVIADGREGQLVDFFDVEAWSAGLIRGLADPRAHDPLRQAAREKAVLEFDLNRQCLPRQIDFVESWFR